MNHCLVSNCATPTKLFVCDEHETLMVENFMTQMCMLCGNWGAMGQDMLCRGCQWHEVAQNELERFQRSYTWWNRYVRPGFALSEIADVLDQIEVNRNLLKEDRHHTDETTDLILEELSERLKKQVADRRGWIGTLHAIKWTLTVIGAPGLFLWVNLCT